jgi:hypothetical protein
LAIVGVLALAVCAAAAILVMAPVKTVPATVSDVRWQTSVPVQQLESVRYSNEAGSPPSDGYDVSCHTESEEVCEQETIDRGDGFAEIVEDCHTETPQYCDYSRDEWRTFETLTQEETAPSLCPAGPCANQQIGAQEVV